MMSPGASQPVKKQRATATPKLSTAADDAIARRRAELRRLAQQQQQPKEGTTAAANHNSSAAATTASGQPGLFSSFDSSSFRSKPTTTAAAGVARRLDTDFQGGGTNNNNNNNATKKSTASATLSGASPWGRTLGVTPQPASAKPSSSSGVAGSSQKQQPPSSNKPAQSPIATNTTSYGGAVIEEIDEPPLAEEEKVVASTTTAAAASKLKPPSPPRRLQAPASSNPPPRGAARPTNSADNNNNTTISSVQSIAAQRLEQEVKEQEALKLKALRQVKELEEKLMALEDSSAISGSNNNNTAETPLESFLELVDTVGEAQAMEWARSQVTGGATATPYKSTNGKVGFTSPMADLPETPSVARPKRIATPHPKRDIEKTAVDTERQNHAFFIDAAKTIPYEYETELATYCVRRPYGLENARELFERCSLTENDRYGRRAHVSSPSSLEVVATILPDESYLVLSGKSNVRIYNQFEGIWKEYTVDTMDRPLGHVSYIDNEAQEKEYSLDEIYEAALLARDHYCSTLYSTALSLRDRPASVAAPSPSQQLQKSPTNEIGVNTDEMIPPTGSQGILSPHDDPQHASAPPPPHPVDDDKIESSGSADITSTLLGLIFGSIVALIWTILWKIPLAMIRTTVVLLGSYFLISLLWMFSRDEGSLGSSAQFIAYNRPGIF